MSTYTNNIFTRYISQNNVNIIFELGSRDLIDGIQMLNYYRKTNKLYSFECNPTCVEKCIALYKTLSDTVKDKVDIVTKAVSLENGPISFMMVDENLMDNCGASSIYEIDFSNRIKSDPDRNRNPVQKKITVDSIRLDTFCNNNNIKNIDLIAMDLQGYELNALKSLGLLLQNVKYIITETCIQSTYKEGCNFKELYEFLSQNGFKYMVSDKYGNNIPPGNIKGWSEFNCLFKNSKM
jgi:FkbM family methyltransferase